MLVTAYENKHVMLQTNINSLKKRTNIVGYYLIQQRNHMYT